MHKSLAYSLMLAATLGLAACDSSSENKAEDARESAADARESMNDARESMNDAARESNEAAQKRLEEQQNNSTAPAYPNANAPAQPITAPATSDE